MPALSSQEGAEKRLDIRHSLVHDPCDFDFAVTLVHEFHVSSDEARRDLESWAWHVDRRYLGSQFENEPSRRLYFFGVFSDTDSICRWDLLVRLPLVPWRRLQNKKRLEKWHRASWHHRVLRQHWQMTDGKSVYIHKFHGRQGDVRYHTKELLLSDPIENFLFSTDLT